MHLCVHESDSSLLPCSHSFPSAIRWERDTFSSQLLMLISSSPQGPVPHCLLPRVRCPNSPSWYPHIRRGFQIDRSAVAFQRSGIWDVFGQTVGDSQSINQSNCHSSTEHEHQSAAIILANMTAAPETGPASDRSSDDQNRSHEEPSWS